MSGALNESASPLGPEEFSQLLTGLSPLPAQIAVAVSGGPDSMALAFCLKKWGQCDLTALIIDHGLRTKSASEAAQVKKTLEAMEIATEILPWLHETVRGRLHEKAREARYALLTEACRRRGISALFTAHHRDDQAETILMRLAKGSGIDGLAGIAPQSERDGIRILRPFLPLSKERLIATCQNANLSFVTDPSNASLQFARGRLRQIMPLLANEGLSVDNLITLGARAAEAKDALDQTTTDFLRRAAHSEIGGNVRLDRATLRSIPRAIALRALTACLRYVHPDPYPPEYAALSSLLDIMTGVDADNIRTLYGCIVSITAERALFLREPSAANEILPIEAGQTILWDKRWLVTAADQVGTLRALGNPPHDQVDALAPQLRRQITQGRIRASLPALWQQNHLIAIPSFGNSSAFSLRYRKEAFP